MMLKAFDLCHVGTVATESDFHDHAFLELLEALLRDGVALGTSVFID